MNSPPVSNESFGVLVSLFVCAITQLLRSQGELAAGHCLCSRAGGVGHS
jgi:hypothetical protein